MTRLKTAIPALLLALCLGISGTLVAEDMEGTVKYRKGVMSAIGGHTGASAQLVFGRYAREGALQLHADTLAALTNDIPTLFPEGSGVGKTSAKPDIWENWGKFESKAEDAQQAAEAFADAVQSGDQEQIGMRFKALGESCKACHKSFRKKDD